MVESVYIDKYPICYMNVNILYNSFFSGTLAHGNFHKLITDYMAICVCRIQLKKKRNLICLRILQSL